MDPLGAALRQWLIAELMQLDTESLTQEQVDRQQVLADEALDRLITRLREDI